MTGPGRSRRHCVTQGIRGSFSGFSRLQRAQSTPSRRNPVKLEDVAKTLSALPNGGRVESYVSDLSRMGAVDALAKAVAEKHAKLDVLINNAGVFGAPEVVTPDGLDVRFAVNTIAP